MSKKKNIDEHIVEFINGEPVYDCEFEPLDEETIGRVIEPQPRTWEEVERKWNRASDMVINEQISKQELTAFADEVMEEHNKQHKKEVNKLSRLWWKRMGAVVVALIMAVMINLILIEYMVGCGESYVDANGVRHWYECVFLNFNPNGGQ